VSDIRLPKQCGLFKPGHNPHWIQMLRASEDRVDIPLPARIIEIRSTGIVSCEVGGHQICFWNHDVDRLAGALALAGGAMNYQARWGLILVPNMRGNYAFCVTKMLDDHVSCLTGIQSATPTDLLDRAGGMTIGIADLKARRFN
jgi:hypothetical protein